MLHFKVIFVMTLTVITECQVVFPDNNPKPSRTTENPEGCTASNGKQGLCYEFRSSEFKECSFFPSIDTSITGVANHLENNQCDNDGTQIFFCCPSDRSNLDGVIPTEEECGQSISNNVVGGNLTTEGQWPWLASIGVIRRNQYHHHCGGILISKQHVISAAHCFTPKIKADIPDLFVRLGEYNVNEDNDGAQDFGILNEQLHKDYNGYSGENDIILLKLDKPLESFSDIIRAACLPYHLRDEKFEEESLIVVGWGIYDNNRGVTAPVPMQAVIPVVPVQQCHERYQELNENRTIDNKQLCAGTGRNGTPDACGGDSGGPLNYLDTNKNRFYAVGVVSYGPVKCGHDNISGVYARIGHYLDWIEENIRQLL